ncbi:hypothetical protein HYDPIDRAFT_42883 [Hydnomerulius pinastri MD-312]|uniref:Transmembrane protein n=1 Tax=Hydnomerulius pinastri MD-312 TaxID=994086 RepID=A0A0C9WBT8_9AGAM|nr:hypothetical protein HYDPIDRAFT_42883 [Hydnomerulius pinastri MD-312]
MGGTKPIDRPRGKDDVPRATGGIVQIHNFTLLAIAIIFSLFFILALSCAFFGDDEDEPYFKSVLNEVAQTSPGIVLLGENVDVDVDEPSITIRWSVIGCGDGYVLDGSSGIHESSSCGLPSMYLQIYVDSSPDPTAVYDPSQLPFVRQTGRRRNIQNLVQFDSDHTLDVHEDRLYPFDTYVLTSTLRAVDASNATVPISKLTTIDQVSSFLVASSDLDSYGTTANGTQVPSRDIDLRVQRPGQARAFTLLLFGLSWMLTHVTFGHVILAKKHKEVKPILKHLVSAFAIVLAIPQLRNAMPDAPGFDGVLIDCIGFFPQMILSTFSVLTLLLLIMLREFDSMNDKPLVIGVTAARSLIAPAPASPKEPPTPTSPLKPLILGAKQKITVSTTLEHGDLISEKRELKGDYVFPPRSSGSSGSSTIHHRSRSSRSFFAVTAFGGRPGSVYGHQLSRSSTLRSVKER